MIRPLLIGLAVAMGVALLTLGSPHGRGSEDASAEGPEPERCRQSDGGAQRESDGGAQARALQVQTAQG